MPTKVSKRFTVTDDGALRPRRKAKWLRDQLKLFAGGEVVVTLERPTRSLKQNAYYWGVVLKEIRLAFLDAGQPVSSEALHEFFKRKYLDPDVHEITNLQSGEVNTYRTYTTTNLDMTQMSDFIERIKQDEMVLQLGCYIPEPGEDRAFAST